MFSIGLRGPQWSCDPTTNGFEGSGQESDYITNQSGEVVTKTTMDEGVMTWDYTNVYADGQLFATYDAQGLHFQLNDWLGTRRVTTDYAGVVEETCASLPYGSGLNCSGSEYAPNEQHFTGKTHDAESGLDYFGARYYASNDARFMSPDWSSEPEAVPYADLTNPQSLGLYSYAVDNPLSDIDPYGHVPCDGVAQVTITVTPNGSHMTQSPDDCPTTLSLFEWGQRNIISLPPPRPKSVSNPQSSGAPNNGTVKCSGSARVLQGNSATIGHPGGFSGSSVGNFPVTANGAAVIPSQWGPSKAFLRPYLNQISGVFPSVNYSFTGIVDVMGGAPPTGFPANSNVQTDLMQLNPGKLILELPGAPQDFETTAVTITAPSAVGCPAGTVQVP